MARKCGSAQSAGMGRTDMNGTPSGIKPSGPQPRPSQSARVVLQEQSTLPVKNAKRMHENVRLFDEAIKAAGARTLLYMYMSWARKNAPESQQAITDAYVGIGRELSATVVPVGLAWQRFLGKHGQ